MSSIAGPFFAFPKKESWSWTPLQVPCGGRTAQEQQQRAAGAATLAAAPQNAGGASAKANGVEEPPLLARESLEAHLMKPCGKT